MAPRTLGLTLRRHPIAFLREDLKRDKIVSCAEANATKDGRWVTTAGLVLVRQMPGSAKGVMFITIEDETGVTNLIVWPQLFEAHRRIVLSSSMLAIKGRVQREGEVIHVIANKIFDRSADLASLANRGGAFPLPHGRGDEFHRGPPSPDPREKPPRQPPPRDIYIPDLRIGSGIVPGQPTQGIKLKPRNFR